MVKDSGGDPTSRNTPYVLSSRRGDGSGRRRGAKVTTTSDCLQVPDEGLLG